MSKEWRIWFALVAALLVIYLPLQNPYWVPGGDSEFYTTVARNLAQHHGFTYGGEQVGIVPPLWPLILAAAMRISSSFVFLKLLPMCSMLGSWFMFYWILRRFISPLYAALVIVLSAVNSQVVPLTFWLHSDGVFCLITTATLLLALQINEGRAGILRIVILIALCICAVCVRLAGVLGCVLVAGALLQGYPRRSFKLDRRIVAAFLVVALTLGAFAIVRGKLASAVSQSQKESFNDDTQSYDSAVRQAVHSRSHVSALAKVGKRVLNAGKWFSWFFWQPLRLGAAFPPLDLAAAALGWGLIFVYLAGLYRALYYRGWFWVALGLYCLPLCVFYPVVNARYLVPLAPLLLVAQLDGLAAIRSWRQGNFWRRAWRAAAVAFLLFIGLCNLPIYAVEVAVERSGDFYNTYDGGLDRDLIAAGQFLVQRGVRDNEVVVSWRYDNLGRQRKSYFGARVLSMLTGRRVEPDPTRGGPIVEPTEVIHAWCVEHGARYYVYQTPVSPWRLWHFRVPWLQRRLTGKDVPQDTAGWRIYEMLPNATPRRILPPPSRDWPLRVPGMD